MVAFLFLNIYSHSLTTTAIIKSHTLTTQEALQLTGTMAAQATRFTFVYYNGPLAVDSTQPNGAQESVPAATAPEGKVYNKQGKLVNKAPHRPYGYALSFTKIFTD
jgi:hypothetical protein